MQQGQLPLTWCATLWRMDLTPEEVATGQRLVSELASCRGAFDAHCFDVYSRTGRQYTVMAAAFGCGTMTVSRAIARERERRPAGTCITPGTAFSEAAQPETQRKALAREAAKREAAATPPPTPLLAVVPPLRPQRARPTRVTLDQLDRLAHQLYGAEHLLANGPRRDEFLDRLTPCEEVTDFVAQMRSTRKALDQAIKAMDKRFTKQEGTGDEQAEVTQSQLG